MERTFIRFQKYWSEAYAARNNHMRSTAQAQIYHSGNSATTDARETEEPQEQSSKADAFVEFANAVSTDRSAFENMSQTNTLMSHQLNDQAQEVASMRNQLARMTQQMMMMTMSTNNINNSTQYPN